MVEQNGGKFPGQFRHSSCQNGRGREDTEDVSGNTCWEGLEVFTCDEAERLEVAQVSESFGE